jgi:hypothetical protein
MGTDPVSTAAVDYLQRLNLIPALRGNAATAAPLAGRRVIRVVGVGQPTRGPTPPTAGVPFVPPTLPLLVGLAGAGSPLAFLLEGDGHGVSVRLGTWSADGVDDAALDMRQTMLLAVLDGSYPVVDIAAVGVAAPKLGYGAFGLGVPSPPTVDPRDGALPIDRLIRSMSGLRWAALVLASPVGPEWLGADRNGSLNEMRAAATAIESTGVRSPLGEHYLALLQARLDAVTDAQARGGWRTAVYLLGAGHTEVAALASAWRAVFSGAESVPEPVRTVTHPAVVDLATRWALPDDPEVPGPGRYRHPYTAQTVLSSTQLAAYVHLPALETGGFGVRTVPYFDALPPPTAGASVTIGAVVERDRPRRTTFSVPIDSLARHAFVAGVTGSGKSNTVLHLVRQVAAAGLPFLVVEPAKAEYRALLRDPNIGPTLRVFTLGRENVSPLRLNPFDVPAGGSVAEHIDLLRTAFESAFGMWAPMPQVLERSLHGVYLDRGWDLTTGTNHRLDGQAPAWAAYPTMTDLATRISAVSRSLGYDDDITANIEAALTTRIAGLRLGGKGALLDGARSLPMADLLAAPTILELEGMGSDDDKAFVMGLLLVRLAEYRRAQGQRSHLVHLCVIEEAHRLLGAAPPVRGENVADPRGGAVETFANLLSEIRAYGQGVVVADQVPTRLAPDILKNTQLKIAHRTVAADDRAALATSMGMTDAQSASLTALAVGRAAVFGYAADAPVLAQIPSVKQDELIRATDDGAVRDAMRAWRTAGGWDDVWLPAPACATACVGQAPACQAARSMLDDVVIRRTFTRIVLSLLDDATSLPRTWPDLVQVVRTRRPPHLDEGAVLRSLAAHGPDWYAARRGTQGGWTYTATLHYGNLLRQALSAPADRGAEAVDAFRTFATEQHAYTEPPYPGCGQVCPRRTCLYRGPVADVVESGRFLDLWTEADTADRADGGRESGWRVSRSAAYELMQDTPDDASPEQEQAIAESVRRVGLCFAQQMLAADTAELPRSVRRITDELLAVQPD